MTSIGNLICFFVGGFWQALAWFVIGALFCMTIVGLPIGYQCFKMASFVLFPFGKQIVYDRVGAFSCIGNVLWIVFGGIPLAGAAVMNGLALCATIIGIPFGFQCFKFAMLALMPFGARIVKAN